MNKEDEWNEVKECIANREKEQIEKYGIDINKELRRTIENRNTKTSSTKRIVTAIKIVFIVCIIVILIPLIYQTILVLWQSWRDFSSFERNKYKRSNSALL